MKWLKKLLCGLRGHEWNEYTGDIYHVCKKCGKERWIF